ncbi:MAG: kynureninase [Actinomycetota bacterium]
MPQRDDAVALDEHDPLAHFRDEFMASSSTAVYADGNSLGPPPRTATACVNALVDDWANALTGGWERWVDFPLEVGDRLGAACLGAAAGQVAVCDSTSVNLFKAVNAAIDGTDASRHELVVAIDEFPTDRYMLQSIASQRDLTYVMLDAKGIVDAVGASTAVVVLSAVNYRSGELLDVGAITERVNAAGAEVVWDLCHAVGVMPLELDAWGVRLAVGCTYKYLNAGPGAPAFVYVARADQQRLRQPLWGWFGQRDQFAMGLQYEPVPGIRSWLAGTPNIIGTALVDEGVAVIARAGIGAIREKSERLVAFATELARDVLVPRGWTVVTPGDAAGRGGHLAIARRDADAVCAALIARGLVIPDFRAPDVLRLGFSPLVTCYVDVYDAISSVATL